MKSLILALAIALGTQAIAPAAHAGIIMSIISEGDNPGVPVLDIVGLGIIGLALQNAGGAEPAVFVVPGVVTVLDADGLLKQDVLAQGFEKAYPFIDNKEVLGNLASAIKVKAPEQFVVGQKYPLSLTESETRSILAASSLSEENIQKIVNDLK